MSRWCAFSAVVRPQVLPSCMAHPISASGSAGSRTAMDRWIVRTIGARRRAQPSGSRRWAPSHMTEHRTVEAHTSLSFRDPLVALGLTKAIVRQSQTSYPPSAERLAAGVARITGGRGVDVVIESVGGALTGQALATLALQGVLTSLGYSAGRQTTIDVTDLIWKRPSLSGFLLFAHRMRSKRPHGPPCLTCTLWRWMKWSMPRSSASTVATS